ncbi:MAG: hypothetical protein ACRDNG_02245 [Gaiellaceae bacterium]
MRRAGHWRGRHPEGLIYDFARAGRGGLEVGTNWTEFYGVCFSRPKRHWDLKMLTLYVNQQGHPEASGAPGVTYAIWGPWKRD